MKKLVFNEGGQPIYLDDLETIQNNILEQSEGFARGLTCAAEGAFFLDTPYRGGSGLPTLRPNMYVLVNGKVLKTSGETLVGGDGACLHVYEESSDTRILENGESAVCEKNIIAVFRNDNKVSYGETYLVKDMKTIQDFLLVNMEVKDGEVNSLSANGIARFSHVNFANSKRCTVKFTGLDGSWTTIGGSFYPIHTHIEETRISSPVFMLGNALVTLCIYDSVYLCVKVISGTLPANPADCNFTITYDKY